jgi:hypothetical protein
VHPGDRERVERSLRRAVQEMLDWNSEFRVVWPDGSVHWLDARGSIYRTSEGKATRILGIVMGHHRSKAGGRNPGRIGTDGPRPGRGAEARARRPRDGFRPDRLAQHISRTMTAQLGADSCSVWRRNEANGLIGFEFAFEGGDFVTKSDSVIAD